jgi:hypothetical protein
MLWLFSGLYRKEWICEHGVGHYDYNLVSYSVHGCDGCCTRSDFPPYTKDGDYFSILKKCGFKCEDIEKKDD